VRFLYQTGLIMQGVPKNIEPYNLKSLPKAITIHDFCYFQW